MEHLFIAYRSTILAAHEKTPPLQDGVEGSFIDMDIGFLASFFLYDEGFRPVGRGYG